MSFSWFRVISAQNHLGPGHLSLDDSVQFFNQDTSISGYFSIFNTCSTDTGMLCPIEIEVENGASYCTNRYHNTSRDARWPSGRASDSGARGRGFDPHSGRRVASLSKIDLPSKKYW